MSERLLTILQKLKTKHYECDDCYYSCPKCEEGCCNEYAEDECNCGADEQNALVDEAIRILSQLTAENSALLEQTVIIQFENEDELPPDIPDDVYSKMFNCSHVDGVRLFPYIEENGQKYFLVMLKEDE